MKPFPLWFPILEEIQPFLKGWAGEGGGKALAKGLEALKISVGEVRVGGVPKEGGDAVV